MILSLRLASKASELVPGKGHASRTEYNLIAISYHQSHEPELQRTRARNREHSAVGAEGQGYDVAVDPGLGLDALPHSG